MTARKNTTLSRGHRVLAGVVVTGAVVIAGIGFAGSYAAVRDLALDKGFGQFANVFPIGIDAGIVVLLALDLLLTWIRIPFPLLRQTAWLLTAATIAFNGAAAWPDPVGVGMHAVIPILFVVSVEAARHAVGRIADITADRHMESVRITRWLLAPVPTFRLWRRMKLWELRSYEEVIRLEQDRLVYQARLRARYGRSWRRKAPVESLMPLRLARYGVPLADTAPAGLAAAGLDPSTVSATALPSGRSAAADETEPKSASLAAQPGPYSPPGAMARVNGTAPAAYPAPAPQHDQQAPDRQALDQAVQPKPQHPQPTEPMGSGDRVRPLGGEDAEGQRGVYIPEQREAGRYVYEERPGQPLNQLPHDVPRQEVYYAAFRQFLADHSHYPSAYQFGQRLRETCGLTDLSNSELTAYIEDFKQRLSAADRSRSDWHRMNGHDHPMAMPQQREEPRTGYEEKRGRWDRELSQPRRQDPTGDTLPAGHRTNDDLASIPQIETDTEPPAPPAEEQGADVGPGPPREPPKKPEPEQKADEQPPAVETVADRYYTAWRAYREKHGAPPNGDQLSQWLYNSGVTGRNGKTISPSTLRRYIASYPCYEIWAEHADSHGQEPTAEELEKLLANRNVMRNNGGTPWTLADLQRLLPAFQKRRRLRSSR
ncbi:hypothetical protein GCM10010376_77800 [Streptomyces violaceusniger]